MKQYLCFACMICCAIATNAQQRFIATDLSMHHQWMDSLSKESTNLQQQMIVNRLLGDTASVFSRGYCSTGFTKEMREKFAAEEKLRLKDKIQGIASPLIFINGNAVTSSFEPDAKTYAALSRFIRTTPFEKIEAFTNAAATAIYGARAANGIILMQLHNESDFKSLQRLYPGTVLLNYDHAALSKILQSNSKQNPTPITLSTVTPRPCQL